MLNFIDKWIDRLEGHCCQDISLEQSINKVYANISNCISDKNSEYKILICGSVNFDIINNISNGLSSKGINCICGKSILYDPDTISLLSSINGIILVEQLNKSSFVEIDKEVAVINDINKEFLGFVLV